MVRSSALSASRLRRPLSLNIHWKMSIVASSSNNHSWLFFALNIPAGVRRSIIFAGPVLEQKGDLTIIQIGLCVCQHDD